MPRKLRSGGYAIALRPGTLSPGQLSGVEPFIHPTLGAGKIMRKLKKVGKKIVKGVKKVVNKVPGLKQLAKMAISVIPGASTVIEAGKAVKGVAKGIKKIKQIKQAKGKAVAALRPKALPKPKVAAVAKPGKKPVKTAAAARPVPVRAAPKPVAIALAARASSSPSSAKAKQYPPNARMLWDAGAGLFRVFVPLSGFPVAFSGVDEDDDESEVGVGLIRPSLTLSLLGATDPTAAASAKAAIAAVQAFIAKNRRPPAIKLPAVAAFQRVAGGSGLKVDGLWGSNTKAAAGYHLPGVALPAIAPAFNVAVTWRPPAAAGPAKTLPKKPPPKASFAPPPGYVEVGTESKNPGLPPAGYTGPAAPPAPPVPGTPPQPAAPGGGGGGAVPVIKIGTAKLNPPSPGWSPAGGGPSFLPQLNPPSPGWSPAGSSPATLWQQDQQWINSGAEYRSGAGGGSGNTPLWLALAYLYATRNRRAA